MSYKIKYENPNRKIGLSGLMRVKDDALTLEASIDSCIDGLDELIITYNDCTDNSAEIIEKKRLKYPDKIKVYPYPYHVYAIRMSKEEYDYAMSLPEDSPHLLSNYYNNALSKVNYKYVVKIDADQIYFTDRLKYFRKLIKHEGKFSYVSIRIGHFIWSKFWVNRDQPANYKTNTIRYWVKVFLYRFFKRSYYKYIFSLLKSKQAFISLSGINMIKNEGEWYITLCCKNANYIVPYNGEGDHLIFEATEDTCYLTWYDWVISLDNNTKFNLIERFFPDRNICLAGLAWVHLKYMRPTRYAERMQSLKERNDKIVKIDDFFSWKYNKLLAEIDAGLISENKIKHFSFVHDFERHNIKKKIKKAISALYVNP